MAPFELQRQQLKPPLADHGCQCFADTPKKGAWRRIALTLVSVQNAESAHRFRRGVSVVFRSLDLRMTVCASFMTYCAQHGKSGRGIAASCLLFIAAFTLTPAKVFAEQEKISIDSFRVLNTTPEFADIEIVGSNDGSKGPLCLGAIAKSRDGEVRSEGYPPYIAPADKQFRLSLRVLRPVGLGEQQTDALIVMVYPCGKDIILRRKFDWPYVWPEKTPSSTDEGDEHAEQSGVSPWWALHENLEEEEFEALDDLIKKWNTPSERDENGAWKLDSFRSEFLNYSTEKRDWKGDLNRIHRWHKFNPKSAGAAIAEARYWAAYAWHVRGCECGDKDVDPFAMKVFRERMKRAEKILKGAKKFLPDNPLWYETYLDIAVATQRDDRFVEKLLDEAARKHPYFQPLYSGAAKQWAPMSGEKADWNKIDDLFNHAVAATKVLDGTSNYARLYVQINRQQKIEFNLFRDSFVSWPKMRDSFFDLVERYPSADNLNEFAAYACRAGDKNTFLKIRAQIINRIVPNKWPGNYSFDLCDRRFMQEA